MPDEKKDETPAHDLTEHYKRMSKLGARKGAKARANSLTPAERSSIAREAARSRWGKSDETVAVDETASATESDKNPAMPFSLVRGALPMGDVEMECHVLSDLTRVLTQREVVRVITAGVDSGKLQGYLSRNPLIPEDFLLGKTVQFRVPGTQFLATGYDATLLVEICDKYLEARQRNLLKGTAQKRLALQSEVILRACAKVGIIALIDEATGYQKIRAHNALQLKLQAFIADDLQEWARMFPQEFWLELARLEGIRYSPRNRPLRWGKYIMMFVYDAIDSDIGKELRKKNPNPHFKKNHHQWLKQFGRDKVNDQLQRVITIMKLCDNMDDFRKKFAKVFRKSALQMSFDDLWQ